MSKAVNSGHDELSSMVGNNKYIEKCLKENLVQIKTENRIIIVLNKSSPFKLLIL